MYLNENQIQPTQLGDHDPGSNEMQCKEIDSNELATLYSESQDWLISPVFQRTVLNMASLH